MAQIYMTLKNAPALAKDIGPFMAAKGITARFLANPENGQYGLVHLSKGKKYIVARGSDQTIKSQKTLLYTGPSVVSAPGNISFNKDSKYYYMPIGSVQGLYYDEVIQTWVLCNTSAYNCNNLQWISIAPLGHIVHQYLDMDLLDANCAYTILISTYHNNLFVSEHNSRVFILNAQYTDQERIFEQVELESTPLAKYMLTPAPHDDKIIQSLLKESTLTNLFTHSNIVVATDVIEDKDDKFVFGILEQSADGSFSCHASEIGSTILKIIYNSDLKAVMPHDRYNCALIKIIFGINNEERLLSKLAPHHHANLRIIHDYINNIVKLINKTNISEIFDESLSASENKIISLFAEKFKEHLNMFEANDENIILDCLKTQDFVYAILDGVRMPVETVSDQKNDTEVQAVADEIKSVSIDDL